MKRRRFLKTVAAAMLGTIAAVFVPGRPWTLGVSAAEGPGWGTTQAEFVAEFAKAIARIEDEVFLNAH